MNEFRANENQGGNSNEEADPSTGSKVLKIRDLRAIHEEEENNWIVFPYEEWWNGKCS